MLTVPSLLASAHGQTCHGPLSCFFCGAPCDGTYDTAALVKDSFTGRAGVRAPGSRGVCVGCVLCLREDAEIVQVDGTPRRVTKGCMRAFSWVVTATSARAGSKAHLDLLRRAALEPPPPPFALVLSDSGQTHQLYRGVVNHDLGVVTVTLEAEPITYRPDALADRLGLVARLAAACGKPALTEPPSVRLAVAAMSHHGDAGAALLEAWQPVWSEPLSRLAVWLSPNKETCAREYPAAPDPSPRHGGVPPQAGWSDRPRPDDRDERKDRDPRSRQPLLFDSRPPLL